MVYAKAVTPSELRLAEVVKQFVGDEFTLVLEAPVESKSLGLCGRVDAVAVTSLEAVPIEVKLEASPEKVKKLATHHLAQVVAYAIAVEETFRRPARRALIVSIEGGTAFEVRVGPVLREHVHRLAKELWRVVEEEKLPRPTASTRKCSACFYKKFCSRL